MIFRSDSLWNIAVTQTNVHARARVATPTPNAYRECCSFDFVTDIYVWADDEWTERVLRVLKINIIFKYTHTHTHIRRCRMNLQN